MPIFRSSFDRSSLPPAKSFYERELGALRRRPTEKAGRGPEIRFAHSMTAKSKSSFS